MGRNNKDFNIDMPGFEGTMDSLNNLTRKRSFTEAKKDLDYEDDTNTDRSHRTEASFERRPES